MPRAKKPKDERGWLTTAIVSKRPPQSKEGDNLRIFQRIVGETLTVASHPEGFMKGVEARVDEVNRAKRTNEAEQVLVELVAATAYLQFPMTSRRQINAFEKAKEYLRKRKIDWED